MLFGVIFNGDQTNFAVITASSEESATDMLNEMGYADFEVVPADMLVNEQYGGLAFLSTGD